MDFFIGLIALFFSFFSFFYSFFNFNNIFQIFILITFFLSFFLLFFLSFFLCFFFLFFLPFLLSHVADRVLVLRLDVRPEPLMWESQAQDIGPRESSWPQVISISKSSPRDHHLNAKMQLHSTTSKLQCWTPHAKQLARQEHNSTH